MKTKRHLSLVFSVLAGSALGIGVPTGVTVAPVDYTQAACNIDCSARLSWSAPAEGTPTGYKVWRRTAAHETPVLAGTTAAGVTSFTNTTATLGQAYLYTVTAIDAEGESAESSAVAWRKVENVVLASKGNVTLNSPTLENGAVANVNDGNAGNNAVCKDNTSASLIVVTFKADRRPVLSQARLNFGSWGDNKTQKFYGNVLRNGVETSTDFNGATPPVNKTFTQDAWNQFPVAASLQNDVWTKFTFGGGSYYGNAREIEAYGYFTSALIAAPTGLAALVGDAQVVLLWNAAANAATYSVYRKAAGEETWTALATALTTRAYTDTTVAAGVSYTYRVAAVAANGDEASDATGISVTAVAQAADIPAPYGLTATAINFTQAACNVDCSAQLTWSIVSAANFDKVRVYRAIKGEEDETPDPIATLDKATTTYTNSAATISREYVYTVAGYDSATGKEGPRSNALTYRKVKNVGKQTVNGSWAKTSGEPLTTWGNWQTWANLSDGTAGTGSGIRIEGNGTITYTFTSTARPKLVAVRAVNANMNGFTTQKFTGTVWLNSAAVAAPFDGANANQSMPVGAWKAIVIASAYSNDVWNTIALGNVGGSWEYPCFSEVEAYGYIPGDTTGFLGAPELSNPTAGRKAVSLAWTTATNAASYKIYRKVAEGAWVLVASGITATSAEDATVTFDGTTYSYRVAAVAANGDELSSVTKTVLCPAGAPYWWNFLNVKSIAFPGASAYQDPSKVKPHYMSRDKAGTLLVAPMSTDSDLIPAATFDFAALVSADNLGEIPTATSGLKLYTQAGDFGGAAGITPWKGAAVSDALVVLGNGAAVASMSVIDRTTGACDKYAFTDESDAPVSVTVDGGIDFNAAGAYLYANSGSAMNTIVKWSVDTAAKKFRRVATYTMDGYTRIRNIAIYTVDGAEVAFFGEGSAKTGKIGMMNLADGTFTTLVTDATNLNGDIVNVKLSDVAGERFLVAQLDTAAVAVYLFDAATKTATLEKAIDAATMQALYGTAASSQYRNFEMTADGRYALFMNNAGTATRLVVVGAAESMMPAQTPALSVACDYTTKHKAVLSWSEPVGVNAEAVRIFRSQKDKPGAAVLADIPFGTTTYTNITAVAGVTYLYSAAYVHTINGQDFVGSRSAEVEATPLFDLKTKKTTVETTLSDGSGTVYNLVDDNTATVHGDSQWGDNVGVRFSEKVQLMACRYCPANWGTIHRGDNLRVFGNVVKETHWTVGATQIGTGPVVSAETWYDVTLNSSAAPASGWDYFTLASGYPTQPYLNLREVDFYGALPGPRAAALAKASETGRDDAPTNAVAAGHAVTWTESGSLAGVRILRARTPEGPFVQVGTVAAGVGSFTDATAVDGVVYYYQLAYENEFEGVRYVGTLSDVFGDNGALLSGSGYRSAVLQDWTSNWSGGYTFDGVFVNTVNGPSGQYDRLGLAFNVPVVVNAVGLAAPAWSANANGYRIDNVGIYAAPAGVSGIEATGQPGFSKIASATGFTQIGTTPSGCHTADKLYITPIASDEAWSYLFCTKWAWFASINEMAVYGWPKTTVDTAKTLTLMPVYGLAAGMAGEALTLSWTPPNAFATSYRVERRVNGGAWVELAASLEASATSFTDSTAEVGKHNEYRVWSVGTTESVYETLIATPLLREGDRAFVKCANNVFVDCFARSSTESFTATLTLAATNKAVVGADSARISVTEEKPLAAPRVLVTRDMTNGQVVLTVMGPGCEAGTSVSGPQVPACDAIRLTMIRSRSAVSALYHTAAGGWVTFAEYTFTSAPFTKETLFVGASAYSAAITEATPSAMNLGTFKISPVGSFLLIIR